MSKKKSIFSRIKAKDESYISDFLINKKYIYHSLVWKVKYDLTYDLNKTINFYKKNHVSII